MLVYVTWDGDKIGRMVGRARLADDVAEVRRVDRAINAGNELWRSYALKHGGSVIEIAHVNTYSWHPNTRGPQVYRLYASDGVAPNFNPAPKAKVDPASVGWKLIATVNTDPGVGDSGGQYGVSITDTSGSFGKFRYLLSSCFATETDDPYGNTFYSEIVVLEKK